MLGKHKFAVGDRVKPSQYGIDRLIFSGVYRGVKRANWRGKITAVDRFNSPTVLWDQLKRPHGYHPDFIEPDDRKSR